MNKKIVKEIDLGEYIIKINYRGDGKLDINVLDELREQIEGIYISNGDSSELDIESIING
tara:strand:+ start:1970 stop:2149 length:180 start_codon:yes stop_codon:yes gene_type:complete